MEASVVWMLLINGEYFPDFAYYCLFSMRPGRKFLYKLQMSWRPLLQRKYTDMAVNWNLECLITSHKMCVTHSYSVNDLQSTRGEFRRRGRLGVIQPSQSCTMAIQKKTIILHQGIRPSLLFQKWWVHSLWYHKPISVNMFLVQMEVLLILTGYVSL